MVFLFAKKLGFFVLQKVMQQLSQPVFDPLGWVTTKFKECYL
ncbi:hypothetical protein GA0061096_0934 [Fictibacillus enclensis]|nr:hypothetical protein GA0061096_0934 [Fictibacillus enclensis]